MYFCAKMDKEEDHKKEQENLGWRYLNSSYDTLPSSPAKPHMIFMQM